MRIEANFPRALRSTVLVGTGAMLANAVCAQPTVGASSMTLYGVTDACISRVDLGSAHRDVVASGCYFGSRLGYRGREDLGGGQSAWLMLESGLNIDDGTFGQGGRMFGRRALVGFGGGTWGSLEAGRDNAPTFYLLLPIDPMGLGFGTAINTIWAGAPAASVGRTDNAVNYLTPSWGPFTARLQYGFGELVRAVATPTTPATENGGGDVFGANGVYKSGGTQAGIAFGSVRNAQATARDRAVTLAARQDIGRFSVSAVAQSGAFEGSRTAAAPASNTAIFSRSYRSYLIGGSFRATPRDTINVSFKRYDDRTSANLDARQFSVTFVHGLSKRTDIYVGASRLRNSGNGAYSIQDAANAYTGVTPGGAPALYSTGIKHSF